MEPENRMFKDSRERLPALALAALATWLVFAAINAGFTAHTVDMSRQVLPASALSL